MQALVDKKRDARASSKVVRGGVCTTHHSYPMSPHVQKVNVADENILSNGVHSLIRIAGIVESQGAGTATSHPRGNIWESSSIQIRDSSGRLTELRNVISGDYLYKYLSPNQKATWYLRRTVVKTKTLHLLVAVKTTDLSSYDEASLKPKSYPRSLKANIILTLVWSLISVPTLFLTAPVAVYFLFQVIVSVGYGGYIPPRSEISEQFKRRLREEGFYIPA